MILTCAIIDDEPLARALLESYVQKTSFLRLVGQYESAPKAMHDLASSSVDLVFLDIQMPDLDGMKFAHLLPARTKVIFTTAFSEYAVEGFRVSALDYLLKPIDYREFLESANKALTFFQSSIQGTYRAAMSKISALQKSDEEDYFYVKSEYKMVQVQMSRLLYVEGLKDYLRLYIEDEPKPLLTLLSMKTIEEKLPKPRFLRIHRSYIVQMDKVQAVNKSSLVIQNTTLPISEGYRDEIYEHIAERAL